ncbi:FIG00638993: hypothetical protein [Escherichia coli ISC41]|nr:FIG00638993: hypothetical protein [Escherichia coli ISC41]
MIIYNSEGNYNIIDSVDTEYIEKTSAVPNNALFEIYFYYPGGNLLNASDKLFLSAVCFHYYRIAGGLFNDHSSFPSSIF